MRSWPKTIEAGPWPASGQHILPFGPTGPASFAIEEVMGKKGGDRQKKIMRAQIDRFIRGNKGHSGGKEVGPQDSSWATRLFCQKTGERSWAKCWSTPN